ncbi:MAG: proline--tRNA ligase [Planctomycetes bacterium]|nr:proline--tRNA ligase [Planctomycetota bacterium]
MADDRKITRRDEDYSGWYQDIVLRAALGDYSPVKGCMVFRPRGYAIWEKIQADLDRRFKETGHQNAYFPLLIPESFMRKEAEHVKGFAPECAVVTHGGGALLEEPLMIRPTSETIIGYMFAKWVESYRDLPLLINQWCNVLRWEMRTRLFLRTTEFLWQEGHTLHETHAEAKEEVLRMLGVYKAFAEEMLALPVIQGRKTDSERFAGALETLCIEALMQDGKALQSGTSHDLGQNFAKAFDIEFTGRDGGRQHGWSTSWGVSTRLIGALVMAHSDDQGLVLPPRIAPEQVVIVPIWKKDEEKPPVCEEARRLQAAFKERGLAALLDDRDQFKPGYKFNEWELRGVPVRVEIGPRDVASRQCVLKRRTGGDKEAVPLLGAAARVVEVLEEIQQQLYARALALREANTHVASSYGEFKELIEQGGFIRANWDGTAETEEKVKNETKATIRCLEDGRSDPTGPCMVSGREGKFLATFARAY